MENMNRALKMVLWGNFVLIVLISVLNFVSRAKCLHLTYLGIPYFVCDWLLNMKGNARTAAISVIITLQILISLVPLVKQKMEGIGFIAILLTFLNIVLGILMHSVATDLVRRVIERA